MELKGIDLALEIFQENMATVQRLFLILYCIFNKFEKLLIKTPWPIIILAICGLAWLGSRSWKLVVGFSRIYVIGYFGMWKIVWQPLQL